MNIIDRSQPEPELIRARDLAGAAVERQMRKFSKDGKASPKGFRWIKTDWTYPSFEHFTFAYKNQVFPVFVELMVDGKSQMRSNEKERFLVAAEQNNLIPCTFRVNVNYKKVSSWKFWEPEKIDRTQFSLSPYSDGWNLWDLRTGNAVDPSTMGDDSDVEMSAWEKIDFCVQNVKTYLEKEGYKIDSYCSLPEIEPQIWFQDKDGYHCWCIVRFLTNIEDDDYHKHIGLEEKMPQLKKFDGYFAGVSFASASDILRDSNGDIIPLSERFTGKAPLYRGDGMYVRFMGLKRVYVAP